MYPTQATDLCFNLEEPWPICAGSQLQILASHVLEHLTNYRRFFQEAWTALAPEGLLYLRVPYGGHPAAWWDLGHIRPWFIENFVFLQPGYAQQIGNPQHDGWQWPFRIEMIEARIGTDVLRLWKRLWFRRVRQVFAPYIRHFACGIEELFVALRPLKTQEAVQAWLALNAPNAFPCRYVCWQHQWTGNPLAPGEDPALHILAEGIQLNGYCE